MKTLNLLLFVSLLSFYGIISNAQQFKWVKGGGSTDGISPPELSESSYYICTDPNGNIYSLSALGATSIVADTFSFTAGYTASGNNNLLITSYNCSGQMRWAKLISSAGGSKPFGIACDSLGNVYIAGDLYHADGPLYVGYDTTLSDVGYEAQAVVKFDTIGHFNWIRFVGNTSLSSLFADIDAANPLTIDGSNNAHYFCYMKSGLVIMPGDTSHYGVYDLVYNAAGTLLSAVRLDLDSEWFLHGAVIDPATNKLYVYGENNQSFYAGSSTDTFFAAAFDASRNLLWFHIAGHGTNDDGLESISLDKSKHLHFTGNSNGVDYFYFNGDSVLRSYSTYNMSVLMTTDTNGNPLWFKHWDCNTSVNALTALTILPNNKMAVTGFFAGLITDSSTSYTTTGGTWMPYLVVVDSNGHSIAFNQLLGDGSNATNSITSDRIGNIYVGGSVADSIWAENGSTSISAYISNGGNSDFFVMKYGIDCNCTSSPTASYTDTGTHLTKTFFFTGTTTGIDSIVWNFGDGTSDTGISFAHTYSDTGTYHLCVTVYSGCGNESVCSNVGVYWPVGVQFISNEKISVYPNPVKNELVIENAIAGTEIKLFDVVGQEVYGNVISSKKQSLNISGLVNGVYVMQVTGVDGSRNSVRVVKE